MPGRGRFPGRVGFVKVLVAEPLSEAGIAYLDGHDDVAVDTLTGLSPEDLIARIAPYDTLVIRSETRVDARLLERAENLKVVGRAGIGLDNVDVAAATRAGVLVVNAPQSNVISAAEHTIALMLAQARNIPQAHNALVGGAWERSKWQGVELAGKTLGIVGLGRVGTLVAQRAGAFGMRLVAYDPYVAGSRAAQLGARLATSVAAVCEVADFLTIHLPRTQETEGIIGKRELAVIKPGARIVNTARGGLVDEEALLQALEEGRVAGCALDVFNGEPVTEHPLFGRNNVVVTPHLGASTAEAQDKAGVAIAEQVVLALRGQFVPYAVNLDAGSDLPVAARPYLGLADKLGRMAVALAGPGIESLRFEYHGGISEIDTRALTLAGLKGGFSAVMHEPVTYVNAPLLAKERGITVEETKLSESLDYVNLVEVHARGGDATVSVGGTVVGKRDALRLVRVYGYDIDTVFAPIMAFFRYVDRPGVIGIVGTHLGQAGVNIANMQVGRQTEGGEALMALAVDSPIPEPVLAAIAREADFRAARLVVLPD
ncbi:phosphoglycerate dehydrogenase [soil metagenome]